MWISFFSYISKLFVDLYTEKIIMAIVYRHIRLDKNEPFYIGIGKDEKKST